MKKNIFIISLIFLFPIFTLLSQEQIDIIYLNNGDIVKGLIIENVPDDHLKIELSGGSTFIYKYSEILCYTLFPKEKSSNELQHQSQNLNIKSSKTNPIEKKDKGHAMWWMSALWPGLGQFYNDEPIKGTLMAVGQGVALVALIGAVTNDDKYGEVQEYRSFIIGTLMVGNIIYSMIDARNVAEEINRKNGLVIIHEDLSRFVWRDSYNIVSLKIDL